MSSVIRLNKYISSSGFCSRREADRLIEQGKVTYNGQQAVMGQTVAEGDEVRVNGQLISHSTEKPIYLALNKPKGITCTTELHVEGNIIDFIGHQRRIFPIGRLDKASEGLIFLTSDGDIVNKILRAGNAHEKEYVVRVDKPITDDFLHKMGSGVSILDTVTLPCKVVKETKFSFRITLIQGLNRQLRRMCEALDYKVLKLRRVRIMNVTLDGIKTGKWRYLTQQEMDEINRSIATSDGAEKASRIDHSDRNIPKATDAKLYDSRINKKEQKTTKRSSKVSRKEAARPAHRNKRVQGKLSLTK